MMMCVFCIISQAETLSMKTSLAPDTQQAPLAWMRWRVETQRWRMKAKKRRCQMMRKSKLIKFLYLNFEVFQ